MSVPGVLSWSEEAQILPIADSAAAQAMFDLQSNARVGLIPVGKAIEIGTGELALSVALLQKPDEHISWNLAVIVEAQATH